jgi:serine/threonine-protein kinase
VRPIVRGLAVLFGLIVAGGTVIQITGRGGSYRVAAGERPLELAPQPAGFLRVLARPWAEVWIDGQRIDVTPFARAIPLTPGKHYVTLIHPPSNVTEKREIEIVASETQTVDVALDVPGIAPAPIVEDAGKPDAASDNKRKRGTK